MVQSERQFKYGWDNILLRWLRLLPAVFAWERVHDHDKDFGI